MMIAIHFTILATAIFGILSSVFDNPSAELGKDFHILQMITHSSYLFIHEITSVLYFCYLIILTDTFYLKKKLLKLAIFAPIIIVCLLIITNLFYPVIFHITENGLYSHSGDYLFSVLYIIFVIYLIIGILYILKYRKLFSIEWLTTLFAPYLLTIGGVVIEALYGYLNIEILATSLAFLFLSTNIQRPEELTDFITGLANDNNYETNIKRS